MLGWLDDLVTNFVCWIETAVAFVFNGVVSALGAVIGAVLALLPSMPSQPSIPAPLQQGLSWANYFFPVGFLVSTILAILALELTLLAVSVALRWGRAVS